MITDRERIETLERAVTAQQEQIVRLQGTNDALEKRIIEALRGVTADFENRVVETVTIAIRNRRIII